MYIVAHNRWAQLPETDVFGQNVVGYIGYCIDFDALCRRYCTNRNTGVSVSLRRYNCKEK